MKPTIGVLGGTGNEGKGSSVRWAHAGYPWSSARATRSAPAAEIAARLPHASVTGADNRAAAERCAIAVLTMPFAAHRKMRVVSAFQNVSAHLLESVNDAVDCDVLICGDNAPKPATLTRRLK
jgi:predicted dinucleotide-binding enzyme